MDEFKANDPFEEMECLSKVLMVMREVLEAFEKKAIAQNKKNIFQKIGDWFNDLFDHSEKSN